MSNNSQVPGTEIACELLLKVTKRIRDQTFRSLKTQDFKNHSIRSQGRRKSIVDVDFKISNSQRTHFMFSFCEWRDNIMIVMTSPIILRKLNITENFISLNIEILEVLNYGICHFSLLNKLVCNVIVMYCDYCLIYLNLSFVFENGKDWLYLSENFVSIH